MNSHNFLGSNINKVKKHNIQAILMSLLYEKKLSRIQIAKKTSLSTTTITNLIAELLNHGIVSEIASRDIQKRQRKVGRPQTSLSLKPNARYAIGVHIGIGIYRVAIVNLYAEIIHNRIEEFSLSAPPEDILSRIIITIESVINDTNIDKNLILGVGIGASGLVNYQTGVNVLTPNLGWSSVPIREIIEDSTGFPTTVDNNVRAMAIGEAYFGKGLHVDSLAFVYGRIGVGAGFVISGKVFRGSNTGAGEIGHMIIIPNGGESCRCGQTGCLETLVSEPVIVRSARILAKTNPQSILAKYLNQTNQLPPIEQVFSAAREGDTASIEMLNERAEYLGIALANLVNIFNPELFILGGMFAQGKDLLLPHAAETMKNKAFADMGKKVRVETTSFGWRAGVVGASALALTRYFYQQSD
jgi:glucokinase-like ROK family protein